MKPLFEVITSWPREAPATLEELLDCDVEELRETLSGLPDEAARLVWELRRQAAALVAYSEADRIRGPSDLHRALRRKAVWPVQRMWTAYLLDSARRRVQAPWKRGGSRYEVCVRSRFPFPDELRPVEPAGGYIVIWGGDPSVLAEDGVAQRIEMAFPKYEGRLWDVVFWDEDQKTTWSMRAGFGVGDSGDGARVEFPVPVPSLWKEDDAD